MSNINNGGPAFPITVNPGECYKGYQGEMDGMTLRDYFAVHAVLDEGSIGRELAEKLTGRKHPEPTDDLPFGCGADPLDVAIFWAEAEAAYRYIKASAMLKAREQQP